MRRFAIGDPQAPFDTFLAILAHHGLLDGRGLRADVSLISMGDHFDWGRPEERQRAADDALRLVEWLSAHPPEQVTLLAGNHDLARVGELWDVGDDELFAAQALADRCYQREGPDAEDARRAFRREHPRFASEELVARDLSTFRAIQRDVVRELLTTGRLRLAHTAEGALFVHAGVTVDELAGLSLAEGASAEQCAAALNAALDDAVDGWTREGGALTVGALHVPGNHEREGMGMLYHRPSLGLTDEERGELARPRPRRRFHPARLPALTQVIGHIRDSKCRRLLGPAVCGADEALDGPLRTLVVDDAGMRYRRGLLPRPPAGARVVFVDNGMSSLRHAPERYALLELAALHPS